MYKRMIVTALFAVAFSFVLIAGQAQALTRKECNEEWNSLSASKKSAAKNKTSYVKDCMAKDDAKGTIAEKKKETEKVEKKDKAEKKEKATKTETSAPIPSTTKSPTTTTSRTTDGKYTAGQFATEAEAKRNCPSDVVVWLNTRSKIYHFSGTRDYGNTKRGAYMCQQESNRAGNRAAKNEKQPTK